MNTWAAFFCSEDLASDGQCFHALVQAALVTRGFVLLNNALVHHAVDDRHGIFVGRLCSVLVTGITCLDDIFNLGAHA